jgi:protein TonB
MATIYLADQDAPYRRGVAHALRQRGFEVVEFSSGAELYARTVVGEPDLIVMDTDLEDMDGYQVFARLQRKRPDEPYPVLFVSGFEHPRVARALKQRGAVGFVGKARPQEQVVAAVENVLSEHDPLYDRKLPAALAWLQSRGKSGRLDVEADGDTGYVLLLKGKVLEARWKSLEGDAALTLFAEGLPEARFRFAEGEEESETPPSAAPLAGFPATSLPEPQASVPAGGERPLAGIPLAAGSWEDALAAAREPGARDSGGPRTPARRAGRRVALGIAAALALLLTVGVALAALFPGYVPAGLAGILGNLGIPGADRQVREPVPQLARNSEAGNRLPIDLAKAADASRPSGSTGTGTPVPASSGGEADRASVEPDRALAPERSPDASQVRERAAPERREPRPREAPPRAAPAVVEPVDAPPDQTVPPTQAPVREEGREERGDLARTDGVEPGDVTPFEVAPDLGVTRTGVAPDTAVVEARPAPARPAPSRTASEARGRRPSPALVQKPVLLQRGTDPYYPPELKAQGVTGSVVLNIRVGANGRAQQVEVSRSSGYEAFDQSAVAAVGTFLWEPARDVAGPTETWITQAVTFR